MSKSAPSDSLKGLWAKLLENISSFPSRAILKQQAIPVKITSDEVIISIKNQSWLKQFGPEGSKHGFIVDASNAVFGKTVSKVIVRAPESGDEAIRKEQQGSTSADDDKPAPAQTPVKKFVPKPQPKNEEIQEVVDTLNVQQAAPSKKKHATDSYHSDGVNMVMDLFEGKFIE